MEKTGLHKTLGDIALLIGGDVVGDPSVSITGISGIKEARDGDLAFVAHAKYFHLIGKTRAAAVIAPRGTSAAQKPLILTDNPSLAFSKVISLLSEIPAPRLSGIHPTAVIAKDAVLGKDVAVGPHVVIESGAEVGDKTVVFSGCYIGSRTVIGQGGLIYPNVTIREGLSIGDRVIIHSGAVIGADGFGFISVDGKHEKVPQVGTVVIGDDVEIGANVTIDRARFDKTVIGRGTKIDNLVQIAHNVRIGENCLIVSQVGISGSTTIGNNVTIAGQVGLAGHLTVGDNAVVASKSGVAGDIPANTTVWGIPAKEMGLAKRVNACVQRLPQYVKILSELKKKIEELENRLKESERRG
ncbi:MAG: UDP-3-O-(3-hydroxymyristoyl)glucosamine N-acyltransferase [Candidatus Omnitrophota bacterium]|nr:UDP-3-O-(3-hydroxymyristoyl)glucosamine N-acyltransferase [Candidatus Omnitrophota bacterium]MDZ4242421.1 UDP-3-O-(3-hydroxymyristoyl)glucosamine N-acyltransferase [Candidatus Omnitrophota bacterium]